MKKILALVLTLAMVLSCASIASAAYSGEIKVWVAEEIVDFYFRACCPLVCQSGDSRLAGRVKCDLWRNREQRILSYPGCECVLYPFVFTGTAADLSAAHIWKISACYAAHLG